MRQETWLAMDRCFCRASKEFKNIAKAWRTPCSTWQGNPEDQRCDRRNYKLAKHQEAGHGDSGGNNCSNQSPRACCGWFVIEGFQPLHSTGLRKENVLDSAITDAHLELCENKRTGVGTLLKAMTTLCSAYGTDFQQRTEPHEIETGVSRFGNIDHSLTESPYKE